MNAMRFWHVILVKRDRSDASIARRIQEKVKERIDKNQREYILREQLKLIREELGEDNTVSDADQFTQEAEETAGTERRSRRRSDKGNHAVLRVSAITILQRAA